MFTTEGDDDDSDIEDAIDGDVREDKEDEEEEEEDDDSIYGKSPAKKLLQIEKEQVKSNSDNMVCIL